MCEAHTDHLCKTLRAINVWIYLTKMSILWLLFQINVPPFAFKYIKCHPTGKLQSVTLKWQIIINNKKTFMHFDDLSSFCWYIQNNLDKLHKCFWFFLFTFNNFWKSPVPNHNDWSVVKLFFYLQLLFFFFFFKSANNKADWTQSVWKKWEG